MTVLHRVDTALTHLLAACWADHAADACCLCLWREYYKGAEFTGREGTCLALDNSAVDGTLRVNSRGPQDAGVEWRLTFDRSGALLRVEGGDADALADAAWRMLRLVAEGAATAAVICHPAEWYEDQAA
jgi:hypothetical protein